MDRRRNPNSHSTPAWRQYRQAFDNFREKVRRVQILAADGQHDQTAIDCAVLDMEIAKEDYKTARDTLFLEMIASENHRAAPPQTSRNEDGVRELAELLWELEGRPEGSALNDWYRAENIHRRSFKTCV
jgi:hypothetical protein